LCPLYRKCLYTIFTVRRCIHGDGKRKISQKGIMVLVHSSHIPRIKRSHLGVFTPWKETLDIIIPARGMATLESRAPVSIVVIYLCVWRSCTDIDGSGKSEVSSLSKCICFFPTLFFTSLPKYGWLLSLFTRLANISSYLSVQILSIMSTLAPRLLTTYTTQTCYEPPPITSCPYFRRLPDGRAEFVTVATVELLLSTSLGLTF